MAISSVLTPRPPTEAAPHAAPSAPRRRQSSVFPIAAAIAFGLAAGALMPRGPVTAAQAITLLLAGLALGALAGAAMRSRWAIVLIPVAYALAFEVMASPSDGLTVDGLHLGSTWGVLAAILGRGFHGLVALVPMALGAAVGAGFARRRAGAHRGPQGRAGRVGLVARRGIAAATGIGLILLAVQLLRPASTVPVTGRDGRVVPGSVAELTKVRIGGVDQWLSIRGASAAKPVLLYLPGGPGQSDLGFGRALLDPLTRDFVVVIWDGRGIGKAYPSFDADAATVDQAVADTIEVTDYLRRRFGEDRIVLFGESGGSVTGVLAAQRHPGRYLAWIGSGQMVNPRETDLRIYRDLLDHFESTGDRNAAQTLEDFGPPPYPTILANAWVMDHYDALAGDYDPPAAYTRRAEDSGVGFLGLGASEYTLIEKVNAMRGLMDTFGAAYPRWQTIDFRRSVPRLDVPVYLFTGDHELTARSDLTREWYSALRAPHKRLYSYPDAGHATAFEHADDLQRILVDTVLQQTEPR